MRKYSCNRLAVPTAELDCIQFAASLALTATLLPRKCGIRIPPFESGVLLQTNHITSLLQSLNPREMLLDVFLLALSPSSRTL